MVALSRRSFVAGSVGALAFPARAQSRAAPSSKWQKPEYRSGVIRGPRELVEQAGLAVLSGAAADAFRLGAARTIVV